MFSYWIVSIHTVKYCCWLCTLLGRRIRTLFVRCHSLLIFQFIFAFIHLALWQKRWVEKLLRVRYEHLNTIYKYVYCVCIYIWCIAHKFYCGGCQLTWICVKWQQWQRSFPLGNSIRCIYIYAISEYSLFICYVTKNEHQTVLAV